MKRIAVILLALIMVFSLAACGGSGGGGGGGAAEEVVFTVALNGDPVRIDPAFAYDNNTSVIIDSITEPLLTHNLDNSLKPCLCTSWEATDPTTYVYQIRDDVVFSDGNPMTIEDVVWSVSRHMDPDLGSYLNWFFDNVESVEATGEWEFTVKLKQPDACWKYVLATSAGMIMEKAYAEECGDELGSAEKGCIGSGPFVFKEWINGSKVVLEKNENYWNKEAKTNITRIELPIMTDDTTIATAFKSNQLDFAPSVSKTLVETLQGYDNVDVLTRPGMDIAYFAFNTQQEPFSDYNARMAVQYAIPLDDIANNVLKETGMKGGLLPMTDSLFTVEPEKWQAYVEKIGGHEYNLDKAKEALAASKYPDGFSFDVIVSQANSQHYDVALVVQQSLKELGIEMNIQSLTQDEVYAYQSGERVNQEGVRDYQCLLTTWGADYPDPSANLTPLFKKANIEEGGYNCAAYVNDDVDKLLNSANNCTDESERMDMLIQACDQIIKDRPYYFYMYSVSFMPVATSCDIGDMNPHSAWDWNFKDVVKS